MSGHKLWLATFEHSMEVRIETWSISPIEFEGIVHGSRTID